MSDFPGPVDRPAVRVIMIRHVRAEPEVAYEVASLTGSAVSLIPCDGSVLVVPAGPTSSVTPWPDRMRPVLDITRSGDGSIHIDVFGAQPVAGTGVRARLLARALPTVSLSWPLPGSEGVAAPATTDAATADLIRALSLTPEQADAVRTLARSPQARPSPAELTYALGVPREVAALLDGQVNLSGVPGVVTANRLGTWGTIRESLLARPEGTSLVARMRRWDHDRPALSVLAIVIAMGLAAFAWLYPFPAGHLLAGGWPRAAWLTVAAVLAVDAIGSLIILIAIRRRRTRRSP